MRLRKLLTLILTTIMLLGCLSISASAETVAYNDFDNMTVNQVPTGWTTDGTTDETKNWKVTNVYQTNIYLLWFNAYSFSNGLVGCITTPKMEIKDFQYLTFKYSNERSSDYPLIVSASEDNETFTQIASLTTTSNGSSSSNPGTMSEFKFDLNAYAGKSIYIRLQTTSDCGYKGVFVDDFEIKTNNNAAYLDLEDGETYSDKKDIDQNYTLIQTDETYTDVTKVKLEWKVSDIAVTYKSHKTWDTEKLEWVEAKENIDVTYQNAEFTLTNYSSKRVIGTVKFTVEDTLKETLKSATFDDHNGLVVDTIVNLDHTINETKKTSVPSNTITATLEFNNDMFADLSATTSATKYGTFTVTLSMKEEPTITAPTIVANLKYNDSEQELVAAGQSNDGTLQYALGENSTTAPTTGYSEAIPKAKNAGTYYVWYKVIGDETHYDSKPVCITIEISKATYDYRVYSGADQNGKSSYCGSNQYLVDYSVNIAGTWYFKLSTEESYTTNVSTAKYPGTYEIYYYFEPEDSNYVSIGSASEPKRITCTIVKGNSTMGDIYVSEVKATTVTIEKMATGDGRTPYYGYSTECDSSKVTNWRASWDDKITFTGLTPDTTYFFFGKFEGDDNWNTNYTSPLQVKTEVQYQ